MSLKKIRQVWDWSLKEAAKKQNASEQAMKLVALCIADHYNDTSGKCFPSMERIAARCGLSRRTAIRAMQALENEGYLRVSRGRRLKGHQAPNSYSLTEPPLQGDTMTPCDDQKQSVTLSIPECHHDTVTISKPQVAYNDEDSHAGLHVQALIEHTNQALERPVEVGFWIDPF